MILEINKNTIIKIKGQTYQLPRDILVDADDNFLDRHTLMVPDEARDVDQKQNK